MIQQSPTSSIGRSSRPGDRSASSPPTGSPYDSPPPHANPGNPRLGYLALVAVAICAAVFTLDTLRHRPSHPRVSIAAPPAPTIEQPDPAALARRKHELWQTKIEPELDAADARAQIAVEESITSLAIFLIECHDGSRPFAEAMLSFRGKWNLLKSKAPGFVGGDDQAHLQYLNDEFSRLIFSDADLQAAIEFAVVTYLGKLQAIENDLLVNVRADMADIPLDALPAARSDEIFQSEFDRIARQITPVVARELGVDALREISSFVAGEIASTVLANVAARLGTSSGLLLAGASTSWATLGLSLVAAIIIDQVITIIVDEVRDPVGQLTKRVNDLLNNLRQLIIEGDDQSPGLQPQLMRFDKARSRIRREALRQLILGEQPEILTATRPYN